MKKTATVTLVTTLLAMLVFTAIPPASASPSGGTAVGVTGVSWFSANSTEQAVPGMSDIPLFVQFQTAATMQNLTVKVNLTAYEPGVFNYSYIMGPDSGVQDIYNFGAVPAGTSLTAEQTVNISSNAPDGIYLENLTYTYGNATAHFYGNASFQLPVQGTVNIESPSASFGTQSSPIEAVPGMENIPVTVLLENSGNSPVSNVSVSYSPQGVFAGPAQSTTVPAFGSYSEIPVTFMASISSNATAGSIYGQNLSVEYLGTTHQVHFTLPVTGTSNLSMVDYFTNPPIIYQGQKFISMTIVAANSGDAYARNVNVSLTSTDFSILTNPYNVPAFPSESLQNFTFLMNADNVTGSTLVKLNLGNESVEIPVTLHSYGSYSITKTVPDLHTGASSQELSFNITNTGNTTLYDFTVYYLSPSVISVHVPSSNPLASLKSGNETFAQISPGETVTATYLVDTSSSASFTIYPGQLAISWHLNNTATTFHKTYTFNQKVTPTSIQNLKGALTFTPLNIAVLAVIIALIIGLVAVARRGSRSRKKAKKHGVTGEEKEEKKGGEGE